MPEGKYHPDAPSAEEATRTNRDDLTPEEQAKRAEAEKEYLALRDRQRQMEESREQEDTPRRFDDWREPSELDLDELLSETERVKEELHVAVPTQSEEEEG
jgi:hypothetical protein